MRPTVPLPFDDRAAGGRALAGQLAGRVAPDAIVVALPRGGVPVGSEVAAALGLSLDIMVVRKLGVPGHEELAMGAIASDGTRVLNEELIEDLRIPPDAIDHEVAQETRELTRREASYRGGRRAAPLAGREVILVDDGLATGATMRAAILAARQHEARRVVVAVPVAASDTCEVLRDEADLVVCVATPEPFRAVGLWYRHFAATSDADVRDLLARSTEEEQPA